MRTTLTIDDDEWMASDIDTAPIFVIPAKAGTQGRLRRAWPPWTPASAGATKKFGTGLMRQRQSSSCGTGAATSRTGRQSEGPGERRVAPRVKGFDGCA